MIELFIYRWIFVILFVVSLGLIRAHGTYRNTDTGEEVTIGVF